MRRHIITLLLVGACLVAFTQERVVPISKVVSGVASNARNISWKEITVDKGDISRLSFSTIRRNTNAPFSGEMRASERGYLIKGSNNTPDVVCFAKGVVVRASADSIVINHHNGLESIYKNIVSRKVRVGDYVKKGQLLGRLTQHNQNLLFDLRLGGVALNLTEIFDPQTSLISYSGDIYIYNLDKEIFISRMSPMVMLSVDGEYYQEMFEYHYDSIIAEHRAKRDFIDDVISVAIEDEINLEDVQVGPAKKQEVLKANGEIGL